MTNDDYGGIIRLLEMVYGVGGAAAPAGDASSAGAQQQGEYGGMVSQLGSAYV